MKQALMPNGELILAAENAPSQAVCPTCGGSVVLRKRRLMNNGGTSFYWRHLRNRNRSCQARTNLIQYHIPHRSANTRHRKSY